MTHRRLRPAAALVALALLAAGCATPPPEPVTMRDQSVDFAKFKTFGFPGGASTPDQTATLVDQSIRAAITAEMNRRGYVLATEKPDLLMSHEAASAQKVENNPVRIGVGIGTWGGSGGGSVNVGSSSVRSVKEGTIVIHAVEAARNAEVWQGQMSGKMGKGGATDAAIRAAVGKAMKDFPARPAGQ